MIQVFTETRRKLLMNAASYDHRMEFDDAADELYGLSPGEFVSRRNELVKQVRASGHQKVADAIRRLRRPTLSAWALNQWVRADPDGVQVLLALGTDLAAAQRRAAVARVRELSAERQRVVTDSTLAVTMLAAERGHPISGAAIREVTASLRAAIADEETAAALRSGRLVTPSEYSGFGPAGVYLVPDPTPDGGSQSDTDIRDVAADGAAGIDADVEAGRAAAQAELDDAVAGQAAIREELGRAGDELHKIADTVENLTRRVDELRAQLERADDELRFARRRKAAAEKTYSDVHTRHRAATRRVEAARREVES